MKLCIGYNSSCRSKRVVLEDNKHIPPKSEPDVWEKIDGVFETAKLWVVETAQNSKPDVLIGKTLTKSLKNELISVRSLNELRLTINFEKKLSRSGHHHQQQRFF